MDNLITGDTENIEHLFELGQDRFRFVEYDVTDYLHVGGELDYVLHFASPAAPDDYLQYPIQTLKVGALGTHKALGLAKAKDARLLLASTSEVYGDPLVHPQPEDYWGNVNPIGERGVYDEAKRFGEALAMAYHRYHGVETRIARIFNTYGPRMRIDDGRALPTFMGQALRGEPLTVYGDGSQTRAFCYVDDLVEGIYRLLMSDCAEPVNIGNPEEIIEVTGSGSDITYESLPEDDPQTGKPDISKAKELLDWEPEVGRREGLERTLAYFETKVELSSATE
jgi:dTDP-glucose 4,6-dehydratase